MLALLLRISIKIQYRLFYQIDYCLYDSLPEDTSYFHAQLRRQAITEIGKDYVILDNVKGSGRYVGTYLDKRKILVDFSGFGHLFATQLSCDSCVAFLLLVTRKY